MGASVKQKAVTASSNGFYFGGAGRSRTDLHGFANTVQTRSATVQQQLATAYTHGVHKLRNVTATYLQKVCDT